MPEVVMKTAAPSEAVPTGNHACSTSSFDAVFVDANSLTYFFSGKYFWIVQESGKTRGPFLIKQKWSNLPAEGIDAAYQSRGNITFFKDKK